MLLLRGQLRLDAGDKTGAEESFSAAVEHHPIESEPHYQLAGVYQLQGRIAEAEAELATMKRVQAIWREFSDVHEAAMIDLTTAELRQRLGDLATQLGKPELARRWYEAALSLDPHLKSAREALIELPAADAHGPQM
jgi:Flp pilus assembly protein TadD